MLTATACSASERTPAAAPTSTSQSDNVPTTPTSVVSAPTTAPTASAPSGSSGAGATESELAVDIPRPLAGVYTYRNQKGYEQTHTVAWLDDHSFELVGGAADRGFSSVSIIEFPQTEGLGWIG